MQNKTISFEAAEAAVMQTWKSLLKQTNPYLVPILLPMIEHFKPLFQEFYDLGVSHGRTAQAVPEGFVLMPKELPEQIAEKMAIDRIDKPRHENDPVWSEIAEQSYKDQVKSKKWEFWRDYKAMIEAQEPAND